MNPERPFPRSYWAIPGKLLAGCYPGDLHPAHMEEKLAGLVKANVTLIINLMEVTESDHLGRPFDDYLERLLQIANASGRMIQSQRFPIPDQSIPTDSQMGEILAAIEKEIEKGGTVYVHCWGGKGRTATVIGCFLLEQGRETPDTVLTTLKELTAHASKAFWPTPQTDEQCEFVTSWRTKGV